MAGKKSGRPQKEAVSFRVAPELKKAFEDLESSIIGIKKSKLMADCLKLGFEQLLREKPEMRRIIEEIGEPHKISEHHHKDKKVGGKGGL